MSRQNHQDAQCAPAVQYRKARNNRFDQSFRLRGSDAVVGTQGAGVFMIGGLPDIGNLFPPNQDENVLSVKATKILKAGLGGNSIFVIPFLLQFRFGSDVR